MLHRVTNAHRAKVELTLRNEQGKPSPLLLQPGEGGEFDVSERQAKALAAHGVLKFEKIQAAPKRDKPGKAAAAPPSAGETA